jgi:NADH:ubiquinone oxidoreductase subunit 6 (subunit J)
MDRPAVLHPAPSNLKAEGARPMTLILWIIAVVLVIAGIIALTRKQMVYGLLLIVVGFLVGPGGASVFAASIPGFTG